MLAHAGFMGYIPDRASIGVYDDFSGSRLGPCAGS